MIAEIVFRAGYWSDNINLTNREAFYLRYDSDKLLAQLHFSDLLPMSVPTVFANSRVLKQLAIVYNSFWSPG